MLIDGNEFKTGLETHMENLLKASPSLWKAYKSKILEFMMKMNELERFQIQAGQGFYRVKFRDGMEKILYLFSLSNVSPVAEVRFIKPFAGVVLRKKVAYIPAYSFTIDVPVTLVYWGREQTVLDPDLWKRRRMTSLIIEVPGYYAEYSLANMMWPVSVERYFSTENLHPMMRELAQAYLLNALGPPYFDDSGTFCPLYAPTFVLTTDNSARLISVHKTIFTILHYDGRFSKISMLTSNFKTKTITCELHSKGALEKQNSLHDGLLIATLEVGREGATNPSYYIYPLKIPALGEGYGITLTLLSIILRNLYLRSGHPIIIDAALKELPKMVASILQAFRVGTSELATHIMRDEHGLETLISILEVYHHDSERIMYLHPYILEMVAHLYRGIDKVPPVKTPKQIVMKVIECLDALEKNEVGAYFKRGIVEWLRQSLRIDRAETAMHSFITSSACLAGVSRLTKLAYHG